MRCTYKTRPRCWCPAASAPPPPPSSVLGMRLSSLCVLSANLGAAGAQLIGSPAAWTRPGPPCSAAEGGVPPVNDGGAMD